MDIPNRNGVFRIEFDKNKYSSSPLIVFTIDLLELSEKVNFGRGTNRFVRSEEYGASRLISNDIHENVIQIYIGTTIGQLGIHDGATSIISIPLLYQYLQSDGFDPLYPIRNKNGNENTYNKFNNAVLSILNNQYAKLKLQPIVNKISRIAKDTVDDVKSYINGGVKPRLKPATIDIRVEKKAILPGLYKGDRGIYESLSETGELEESIGFYIKTFRSKDFTRIINSKAFKQYHNKSYIYREKKSTELSSLKKNWDKDIIDRLKSTPNLPYNDIVSMERSIKKMKQLKKISTINDLFNIVDDAYHGNNTKAFAVIRQTRLYAQEIMKNVGRLG